MLHLCESMSLEYVDSLDFSTQKIKIISSKGTSSYFVNYHPTVGLFQKSSKKSVQLRSSENLVCETCKQEIISDMSRFLVMYNQDNSPRFFSFHFFSPCWNSEEFFIKYSDWTLAKTGFSLPENMTLSEKGRKNLQNNESLWS
jgi:hypothetical protein